MPRGSKTSSNFFKQLNTWFDDALRELCSTDFKENAWGADEGKAGVGTKWFACSPKLDIHSAAALIRLFASFPEDQKIVIENLYAPYGFTVVETGDPAWIEHVEDAFERGLMPAAKNSQKHLPKISLITRNSKTYSSRRAKGKDEFEKNLSDRMAEPRPFLCIVECLEEIPETIRQAATQVVRLAEISPQIVLKLHQVLHRPSCNPDMQPILDQLPQAQELQCLTLEQLTTAVRQSNIKKMVEALVRFADDNSVVADKSALDAVKGLGSTKAVLKQLSADIQTWRGGQLDWSEIPRGVLMFGAPGTGKTFAASRLASQIGAHFIATSYADWQQYGHLGDFLAAMNKSFDEARRRSPTVLFIDEIDSFEDRATASGENANYTRSALNGLLEAMDKANQRQGVLVVGACNHPEKLDAALVRSGRFDLKIEMSLPGKDALVDILLDHCGDEITLRTIKDVAAHLIGCTGADAAAIVRQARSLARYKGATLEDAHLWAAAENIVPESSQSDLLRAAYHEAGHIVAGSLLGLGVPDRAEIRTGGGVVYFENKSPFPLLAELDAKLAMLLAGREAEMAFLGSVSTGSGGSAQSDLAQATLLATRLEEMFGLGANPLLWRPVEVTNLSNVLQDEQIRHNVLQRLETASSRAKDVIERSRAVIENLSALLVEKREIYKAEIETVFRQNGTHVASHSGALVTSPELVPVG